MSDYDQKTIESGQSTQGQLEASLAALPRPMSELIYKDDIKTLETQEVNARDFPASTGGYKSNFEWKLGALKEKLTQSSSDPRANEWLASKREELERWERRPSRFPWGGTVPQLGSAQTAAIKSNLASSTKRGSNDSRTIPTGPRAHSSRAPSSAPTGPRSWKNPNQPPTNAPTGPRNPQR